MNEAYIDGASSPLLKPKDRAMIDHHFPEGQLLSSDAANDINAYLGFLDLGSLDNLKPFKTYEDYVREKASKEKAPEHYYDYVVVQKSNPQQIARYNELVAQFNTEFNKKEKDIELLKSYLQKLLAIIREKVEPATAELTDADRAEIERNAENDRKRIEKRFNQSKDILKKWETAAEESEEKIKIAHRAYKTIVQNFRSTIPQDTTILQGQQLYYVQIARAIKIRNRCIHAIMRCDKLNDKRGNEKDFSADYAQKIKKHNERIFQLEKLYPPLDGRA